MALFLPRLALATGTAQWILLGNPSSFPTASVASWRRLLINNYFSFSIKLDIRYYLRLELFIFDQGLRFGNGGLRKIHCDSLYSLRLETKKNHEKTPATLLASEVWSGRFWMGNFNSPSPKPHIVYSNDRQMIAALCKRAGYMKKSDIVKCPIRTATTYRDSKGVKRSVGRKNIMRDSQYLAWRNSNSFFEVLKSFTVNPWPTVFGWSLCLASIFPRPLD